MIRLLFVLLPVILVSTLAQAYEPASGWHWYNEVVENKTKNETEKRIDKKKENESLKAFNQLSASQQLKILQVATNNLKAKAVLSGKVSDITSYKQAQDFWVEKASQFTVGWEKMLLARPDLDYSLRFSNENSLAATSQRGKHERESNAVKVLAKDNGLLFFYRGKDKGDLQFSKVISRYVKENKFTVIPVSVDGELSPAFENGRITNGLEKAHALGVNYFPALVLVNPKTNQHRVVDYGFRSESELSDRLLKITDGWRAEF